jgi:hypothetical protein
MTLTPDIEPAYFPMPKISNDVHNKTVELVKSEYIRSRNFLNGVFSNYITWYELYRGTQTDKNYEGRANLFIPEAYSAVETIYSRIIRSFLGPKVKPQESGDVDHAKSNEILLNWQTRVYDFKQPFKDMVKDALIYGSGLLKVTWAFDMDKKLDHPVIECVDPLDYFFDPDAPSRHEARWEMHRTWKSLEELEGDRSKPYINLDKLKDLAGEDDTNTDSGTDMGFHFRRDTAPADRNQNIVTHKGKFEVFEFWGRFKAEGDKEEKDWLVCIAANNILIRMEENPYKDILPGSGRPFVQMKAYDVPHEFLGMGVIEPIEKLQKELNDTRNQRMDNVTQVINPMWQVVRGAGIKQQDLISRPNGIVWTTIPNGVSPLAPADITQSSYNEETIIKQDIQKTIGIPEVAAGSLQGLQGEAAATILALQESANVRFDVLIGEFATAIREAYLNVMALNQKLMDKKTTVRIEGDEAMEFATFSKEDIKGRFDLDVEVETQSNKIVKRQEAFQLYQLLAANPLVNQSENTKLLLESLERKDIEKLMTLPPPPPPPPPEEPKKSINVALRGDLNALESDDIAVIMGAKQESADPIVREELRTLMQGDTETEAQRMEKLKMSEKIMEEKRLAKKEEADSYLNARKLDIEEKKLHMVGNRTQSYKAKNDQSLMENIKHIYSQEGVSQEETES